MSVNLSLDELLDRLEEIKDLVVRRQDDNLKAWSQTQLWPDRATGWRALDEDVRQICGLVEEYYLHIDAFWGGCGAMTHRPVLLRDPSLLMAFQELSDYCESVACTVELIDLDHGRLLALQRLVWPFLLAFTTAHDGFVAQLRASEPVVANGLVVVD